VRIFFGTPASRIKEIVFKRLSLGAVRLVWCVSVLTESLLLSGLGGLIGICSPCGLGILPLLAATSRATRPST